MTYSIDLKSRLIDYYKNSGKPLRNIASMFNISKSSLHRWVNNINYKSQKIKTNYKTRTLILHFLKRSFDHNPYQTLNVLVIKIFKKYNLILTKATVSNYMKIIGYSKKKITKRLYNGKLKDHLLNRRNIKKQFQKINKDDIICIDESGIHRELYTKYGWCHKSKFLVSHISRKDIPVNHSLIMAISNKKILKYKLYKQQAINTDLYYLFLKELLTNITNKYILMDNVAFHKSKRIKDLVEESGNKILFIPPYSPDFNPIEEVFGELKSYLRRFINPIIINKNIHKLLHKFSIKKINLEGYYRHAFD